MPWCTHLTYLFFCSAYLKDVAAACVFLATKTEECGRKLRDVARIAQSKVTGNPADQISDSVCRSPCL